MKNYKILSLAAIALLFLFSACGDKKEAEPTNTDLITATWKMSNLDLGIVAFGQSVTFEEMGLSNPIDSLLAQDIRLEFKSGGALTTTFTSADASVAPVSRTGSWAFLENETKVRLSGVFLTEDFNSELIDEDFITSIETYTVEKLTNSAMELTSSVEMTVAIPDLPLPVDITVGITISLAKQ